MCLKSIQKALNNTDETWKNSQINKRCEDQRAQVTEKEKRFKT